MSRADHRSEDFLRSCSAVMVCYINSVFTIFARDVWPPSCRSGKRVLPSAAFASSLSSSKWDHLKNSTTGFPSNNRSFLSSGAADKADAEVENTDLGMAALEPSICACDLLIYT